MIIQHQKKTKKKPGINLLYGVVTDRRFLLPYFYFRATLDRPIDTFFSQSKMFAIYPFNSCLNYKPSDGFTLD